MNATKFLKVLRMGVAVTALFFPLLFAQTEKGKRKYDLAAEVKVQGEVQEVREQTSPRGWTATHLLLKTKTDLIEVHLGPAGFLKKMNITFAENDEVEVTGSEFTMAGEEVLLAREVKRGEKVFVLRNSDGYPKWWERTRSE